MKSCEKKSLGVAKPCRKSDRRRSKTRRSRSPRRVIGGRNLAMEQVRRYHKVIQRGGRSGEFRENFTVFHSKNYVFHEVELRERAFRREIQCRCLTTRSKKKPIKPYIYIYLK